MIIDIISTSQLQKLVNLNAGNGRRVIAYKEGLLQAPQSLQFFFDLDECGNYLARQFDEEKYETIATASVKEILDAMVGGKIDPTPFARYECHGGVTLDLRDLIEQYDVMLEVAELLGRMKGKEPAEVRQQIKEELFVYYANSLSATPGGNEVLLKLIKANEIAPSSLAGIGIISIDENTVDPTHATRLLTDYKNYAQITVRQSNISRGGYHRKIR